MNFVTNYGAAKHLSRILVWLVIAGFILSAPVVIAKGKQYKDWMYNCESNNKGKSVCFISQTLTHTKKGTKSKSKVLTIKIGYLPGQKKPMAFLQVPLGVSLPPGITFGIDKGKGHRLPYEFCGPDGCVVLMRLNDAVIKAMKKGNSAYAIIASRKRKGTRLPISLSGFTAAFNALKKP